METLYGIDDVVLMKAVVKKIEVGSDEVITYSLQVTGRNQYWKVPESQIEGKYIEPVVAEE